MKFIKFLRTRVRNRFLDPFTVVCDRSPFWNDRNRREKLFRVNGMRVARSVARKWVEENPYGQARVFSGHHYWPDEEEGKTRNLC